MPRKRQTDKHAKELRRVRQFIARAEGRGYRFPDELKGNLYDYSTQKLKGLKPKKLYEMATAIDEETGEILTGPEKRRRERSLSAKLGALTKKIKGLFGKKKPEDEGDGGIKIPEPPTPPTPTPPTPPPTPPAPEPPVVGPDDIPDMTDIIINNFIDMLRLDPPEEGVSRRGNTYKRSKRTIQAVKDAKTFLLNMLRSVIARDGKQAVARRLEQNADTISRTCDQMNYASDADEIQFHMTELAEILNGDRLTLAEMQEIGEMEEMEESWELPD